MSSPAVPLPDQSAGSSPRKIIAACVFLGLVIVGVTIGWWITRPGLIEQARKQLQAGNSVAAQQLLERHLQDRPGEGEASLLLALILRPTAPRDSLKILKSVSSYDPRWPEALKAVAELGIEQGWNEIAEEALLALAGLKSQRFTARLALAEFYFNTGNPQEALPHIKQCLELKPRRVETYLLLAEAYDDLGREMEMVEPLRQALQIDPDNLAAMANLAYALHRSGDAAEARKMAEACLAQDASLYQVRIILAESLRDLGDTTTALREIRRVLNGHPDHLAAMLLEADLLLFERQGKQAYERLAPHYARHREDRQFMTRLARAAQMAGHRDEARQYQRELQQLIPDRVSDREP